jgi:hypothetical protein
MDAVITCCVCGSTTWVACAPATMDAWCAEHWPAERRHREGEDDDMAKGTHSSSGPVRSTSHTAGAASSHAVKQGAPALPASAKGSVVTKAPGAFKSTPGRGNAA